MFRDLQRRGVHGKYIGMTLVGPGFHLEWFAPVHEQIKQFTYGSYSVHAHVGLYNGQMDDSKILLQVQSFISTRVTWARGYGEAAYGSRPQADRSRRPGAKSCTIKLPV